MPPGVMGAPRPPVGMGGGPGGPKVSGGPGGGGGMGGRPDHHHSQQRSGGDGGHHHAPVSSANSSRSGGEMGPRGDGGQHRSAHHRDSPRTGGKGGQDDGDGGYGGRSGGDRDGGRNDRDGSFTGGPINREGGGGGYPGVPGECRLVAARDWGGVLCALNVQPVGRAAASCEHACMHAHTLSGPSHPPSNAHHRARPPTGGYPMPPGMSAAMSGGMMPAPMPMMMMAPQGPQMVGFPPGQQGHVMMRPMAPPGAMFLQVGALVCLGVCVCVCVHGAVGWEGSDGVGLAGGWAMLLSEAAVEQPPHQQPTQHQPANRPLPPPHTHIHTPNP